MPPIRFDMFFYYTDYLFQTTIQLRNKKFVRNGWYCDPQYTYSK